MQRLRIGIASVDHSPHHQSWKGSVLSLDAGSSQAKMRTKTPARSVVGCIHDTYPMIASCTPIQTSTTVPAMKALTRARRDRMKTAIAANENTPPTTTKRIKLGMK